MYKNWISLLFIVFYLKGKLGLVEVFQFSSSLPYEMEGRGQTLKSPEKKRQLYAGKREEIGERAGA